MIREAEKLLAQAQALHAVEAVEIRRYALGFRVDLVPYVNGLRYTSVGRDNRSFSRVAGYGSRTAAQLGVKLIDKTGRLSPVDCADLVDAMG